MGVKINTGQPKADVSVQKSNGTESNQQILGEVQGFTENPCNVGFSATMTRNLGNYENVKVMVSLYYPCMAEEIDETFDNVKGWVDKKMGDVLEEIDNDMKCN